MAMMWNEIVDKYGEEMADAIIKSKLLHKVKVRYDDEMRVHFYDYDVEKVVDRIKHGKQKQNK